MFADSKCLLADCRITSACLQMDCKFIDIKTSVADCTFRRKHPVKRIDD